MKKSITMIAAFTLFSITSLQAQSIFDKIERISNKVDNAAYKAEKAANTADRTVKTGGKIKGMLSKNGEAKNSYADEKVVENHTQIIILNGDLITAKKMNSVIESSKNVSSSQMKFDAGKSTFKVSHTGSTEKLLNNIQQKSKDIFTDKNIQVFEDGKIIIKL